MRCWLSGQCIVPDRKAIGLDTHPTVWNTWKCFGFKAQTGLESQIKSCRFELLNNSVEIQ